MNKKSIIIAVVFVVLLIFISGAVEINKPESSGEYFTFTDSEGAIVELSHKPQKTAVLFSSLAECWLEAGGEVYATVGEITDTTVTVDLNHPHAGKDLTFIGQVVTSRTATNEEIQGTLNMLSGEGCGCGCCSGDCGSDCGDGCSEGCGHCH